MNLFYTIKVGFKGVYIICAASYENLSSGFPTRSYTKRAVQPQKIAKGVTFLRKKRDCTIYKAKTKALTSYAVTAQLICAFVFAYAKTGFLIYSAHMGVPASLFFSLPICLQWLCAMFLQVSIGPLCIRLLLTLQYLCDYTHLCFVLFQLKVDFPSSIRNFSVDFMYLKY